MTEIKIKIECDCGQRYEFEIEPEQGRMPFAVTCPNCGADGTEKANAVLQEIEATQAAPPAAGSSPNTPGPVGVRIRASEPPAPAPPTPPLGSSSAAGTGSFSQSTPRPPFPAPAAAAKRAKPAEESRFLLGTIGAVVAGVLGMLGWYFLIKVTGYTIGYAAWGVGLLTGAGARTLSGDGSHRLGIIAGACAFLAIIGGQYLYVKTEVDKVFSGAAATAYESRMAYAREAANVQTDDEIKALLVKHEEIKEPTAKEIQEFRDEEQPKLKEFSQGKPSKVEFEKGIKGFNNTMSFKLMILKDSVSVMTLLFLFLGVGSAYKLGASKFGDSLAK